MTRIYGTQLRGVADSSGDAVVKTQHIVSTIIHAVYIKYDSSSAAGTDVTVSDEFGQEILKVSSNNTSGMYYPRVNTTDNLGTDLVYAALGEKVHDKFVVNSKLTLTIDDQTEDKGVLVTVFGETL